MRKDKLVRRPRPGISKRELNKLARMGLSIALFGLSLGGIIYFVSQPTTNPVRWLGLLGCLGIALFWNRKLI